MTTAASGSNGIGTALASRLGMTIIKREGHDLVSSCVHCSSSDAFRLHQDTGVAYCYSCNSKWSPFRLAEDVMGGSEQARSLMIELGVFRSPRGNGKPGVSWSDPLTTVARQKRIPVESLKAYGAEPVNDTVVLPAYGPDGKHCTTLAISILGGKGLFAKGKPAGLFFPHDENGVRLPKRGETWHVVEGPKDACALHGIGLLAAGLNTCRLAAKFARLFSGADVVLIPDRDRAGEEGAQHSARVLRRVAQSIRVAVLPAEFKESKGADVRDVLRRPDGEELIRQAISDAQLVEDSQTSGTEEGGRSKPDAETQIELPDGELLTLTISRIPGKPQRLLIARRGELCHRDQINTDSDISRRRFVKKLAGKLGIETDVLEPLIDPAMTSLADQVTDQADGLAADEDEDKSQATLAAELAAEWDVWHTPDTVAYATIPVSDHSENWQVRSQTFKRYLAKCFFEEEGKAMGSEALSAAINLIEAKAMFDGIESTVHIRLGENEGNIYLDLCSDEWQVVEITADGWQVIDQSPIKFRRSRGTLPLPFPERGGNIDELRQFLNVDDATWLLVVTWLIASLRPRGPYPVLALFAEQGSGKSTTGRLLRSLFDPNSAPLRAEPRDARDLMIAANNSWCLAYDNLSYIPAWLSDALCRLSTGGGFTTRELYTDMDEVIFESQRPVMLTSIEEVATRSDLLDRCLIVWLPTIPEERRRPEAEMMAAFEAACPRILGALLDAVSAAIRNLPVVKLPRLPRMADFAVWATAAEMGLGWPPGTFLTAYKGNRASANDLAIESSLVGRPLLDLLQEQGEWCGTSSEMLETLESRVNEQTKRKKSWPSNAQSLTCHLKRLAPNLREAGWLVEYDRKSSKRLWTIQPLPEFASSDPFASSSEPPTDHQTDGQVAPSDADWRDPFSDDANDFHDAEPENLPPEDKSYQDRDEYLPF